nr:hypothetical protein [Streptomyces rapamycinicus]
MYFRADLEHHARGLTSHQSLTWVRAQSDENIPEVQTRGAHGYPHLAGAQGPLSGIGGYQGEVSQGSAAGVLQQPRTVLGDRERVAVRGVRVGQSRDERITVAQRELWFSEPGEGPQEGVVGVGVGIVEVDVDDDEDAGVLRLFPADRVPRRCVLGDREVGGTSVHGTAGDEDECRIGTPLVGEPGLREIADRAGQVGGVGRQGVDAYDHMAAVRGGLFRRVEGNPLQPVQGFAAARSGEQFGRFLREGGALHLAGRGPRDGVDPVDLLWHLEVRQPFAAHGEHHVSVDTARFRHDVQHGNLAEYGVLLACRCRILDPGHVERHCLDLVRVDVLTTADDEFLDPAGDGDVSRLAAAGQVTGAVPPVRKHLCRGFGLLVVADHDARSAGPQFALFAVRDVGAADGIDEAQGQPRDGEAARTGDPLPAEPVDGEGSAGLGAAVGVEQRYAEDVLEALDEGSRRDGAGDQAHFQRRRPWFERVGGSQEIAEHRRHADEHGAPMLRELFEHLARHKAVHDPRSGADGGGGQETQVEGEAVEQRRGPEQNVVLGQLPGGDIAIRRGPEAAALGRQDALRGARGAGGVEHPGWFIEPQVVAWRPEGLGGGQLGE